MSQQLIIMTLDIAILVTLCAYIAITLFRLQPITPDYISTEVIDELKLQIKNLTEELEDCDASAYLNPDPVAWVVIYKESGSFITDEAEEAAACNEDGAKILPLYTPIKETGTNEYGLDVGYFRRKINSQLAPLSSYTPEELARALARLSVAADPSVVMEDEFKEISNAQ